jgi:hypothetical protein
MLWFIILRQDQQLLAAGIVRVTAWVGELMYCVGRGASLGAHADVSCHSQARLLHMNSGGGGCISTYSSWGHVGVQRILYNT